MRGNEQRSDTHPRGLGPVRQISSQSTRGANPSSTRSDARKRTSSAACRGARIARVCRKWSREQSGDAATQTKGIDKKIYQRNEIKSGLFQVSRECDQLHVYNGLQEIKSKLGLRTHRPGTVGRCTHPYPCTTSVPKKLRAYALRTSFGHPCGLELCIFHTTKYAK